MNFSLGGVKRGTLVITATLLLTVGASACSSEDTPAPDHTKKSSAAPDPAVADKAAVEQLVADFWAAQVAAQNNGNDDPAPLLKVADPKIVEEDIDEIKQYQKLHLLRVGKPAITDVDVTVSGTSATIALCLDEDNWTAEVDGDPVPDVQKFGNRPWGARASKTAEGWKIVDNVIAATIKKTCP